MKLSYINLVQWRVPVNKVQLKPFDRMEGWEFLDLILDTVLTWPDTVPVNSETMSYR